MIQFDLLIPGIKRDIVGLCHIAKSSSPPVAIITFLTAARKKERFSKTIETIESFLKEWKRALKSLPLNCFVSPYFPIIFIFFSSKKLTFLLLNLWIIFFWDTQSFLTLNINAWVLYSREDLRQKWLNRTNIFCNYQDTFTETICQKVLIPGFKTRKPGIFESCFVLTLTLLIKIISAKKSFPLSKPKPSFHIFPKPIPSFPIKVLLKIQRKILKL